MKKGKLSKSDMAVISLLACSVILFVSTIVWSCNFWGGKWFGSDVGVDYNQYSAAAQDDIEDAYGEWNDSGMDFEIIDDDSSINDIWIAYYYQTWLGLTEVRDYEPDYPYNEWEEIDIYLDAVDVDYYPYCDPETIFLHEFGHFLGLWHSSYYDAIMWSTYKGVQHYLDGDDEDCIQDLYPY